MQRRSEGASCDIEVDWTSEKAKHRNFNAVAPMSGGVAAEVNDEKSEVRVGEESGTSIGTQDVSAHPRRADTPVPHLACERILTGEAIPV